MAVDNLQVLDIIEVMEAFLERKRPPEHIRPKLEFPVNKKYLNANPIRPEGEILLLAGDILPFAEMDKENDFFNFLSESFEHTYWIPGNHEYYRSDIAKRAGTFHEKIRSNVTLLNNTAIEHKGVRLLFSTLWSKINPGLQFVIEKSMADFRLIKNNGHRTTLDDYDQLQVGLNLQLPFSFLPSWIKKLLTFLRQFNGQRDRF